MKRFFLLILLTLSLPLSARAAECLFKDARVIDKILASSESLKVEDPNQQAAFDRLNAERRKNLQDIFQQLPVSANEHGNLKELKKERKEILRALKHANKDVAHELTQASFFPSRLLPPAYRDAGTSSETALAVQPNLGIVKKIFEIDALALALYAVDLDIAATSKERNAANLMARAAIAGTALGTVAGTGAAAIYLKFAISNLIEGRYFVAALGVAFAAGSVFIGFTGGMVGGLTAGATAYLATLPGHYLNRGIRRMQRRLQVSKCGGVLEAGMAQETTSRQRGLI